MIKRIVAFLLVLSVIIMVLSCFIWLIMSPYGGKIFEYFFFAMYAAALIMAAWFISGHLVDKDSKPANPSRFQ